MKSLSYSINTDGTKLTTETGYNIQMFLFHGTSDVTKQIFVKWTCKQSVKGFFGSKSCLQHVSFTISSICYLSASKFMMQSVCHTVLNPQLAGKMLPVTYSYAAHRDIWIHRTTFNPLLGKGKIQHQRSYENLWAVSWCRHTLLY